jgi:NADH dehydrogenase
VIIIGGGFGGLDAAKALAHAPVRVTLVDRHNYHLFQPLLYQVATASLSPGDIASPIRWVLRHQRNVRVLLAEARGIDTASSQVLLDPGPAELVAGEAPAQSLGIDAISFDYLIVAAGATHSYFGHNDWAAHAPGLKSLDDALEMRRQVLLAFEAAERETSPEAQRQLLTFVIVGGGPTGVELAGALAEIARHTLRKDFRAIRPETARIVLVEAGPRLLGAMSESLSTAAHESLTRLGVEVRVSAAVTAVDRGGVNIGDERIPATTVLWAAGVAASPLASALGVPLDRAGRVLAEPTLQVPGHPRIFVSGDVCALHQDGKPLPGVAQVAKQQGVHAARNIRRAIRNEPLKPFRYRDYGTMATVGRGSAVAQIGGVNMAGWFAWLIWLVIHIVSLIGFRNRAVVLGEWAWSYVTEQRRVRLITGGWLWPDSR